MPRARFDAPVFSEEEMVRLRYLDHCIRSIDAILALARDVPRTKPALIEVRVQTGADDYATRVIPVPVAHILDMLPQIRVKCVGEGAMLGAKLPRNVT